IGLIIEREYGSGVYVRTSGEVGDRVTGAQLAKAFANNIPQEARDIFIGSVHRGSLQMELEELQSLSRHFDLSYIPEGTNEEQLYWQLLIDSDQPIYGEAEPSY